MPTRVGVHVSFSAKNPRETIVWAHHIGIPTAKKASAAAVWSVSSMVNAPRWKTTSTTSRDRTQVTAAAAHDTKKTHRRVTERVSHIASRSPRAARADRNG